MSKEKVARSKVRVLIVSEPSMFEEAIETLLREEPDLEIVGRETDPHQAVERIRECHPDVVIVADGEGETGLEAELLRLVREGFPMSIVEVHLATNTVCIYWGEQQPIRAVGDLVNTVQHACHGLSRQAEAPLAQAEAESAI